jgi:hypothetical protein
MFRRKKYQPREWELKVTTPAGMITDITTQDLELRWLIESRSNDGYVRLLKLPGLTVWARPAGHVEPDRTAQLDGTAALPDGMRRYW